MIEEYTVLVTKLTKYYLKEMSQATCSTLPVKPEEVEIIKALLVLVGGEETQEIQATCWNAARQYFPTILPAKEGFPFYRKGWNKRGK